MRLRQREVPRRASLRSAAGRLKPSVQALIDLGVVEQREVVGGTHMVPVLGLEWDPPGAAPPGGAGRQHENVPKQAPQGMARAAGDSG